MNADGLAMDLLSDFDLNSLLMIEFASMYPSSKSWASNSSSHIAVLSQSNVSVSSSYPLTDDKAINTRHTRAKVSTWPTDDATVGTV